MTDSTVGNGFPSFELHLTLIEFASFEDKAMTIHNTLSHARKSLNKYGLHIGKLGNFCSRTLKQIHSYH